jgi:hypothetical protein
MVNGSGASAVYCPAGSRPRHGQLDRRRSQAAARASKAGARAFRAPEKSFLELRSGACLRRAGRASPLHSRIAPIANACASPSSPFSSARPATPTSRSASARRSRSPLTLTTFAAGAAEGTSRHPPRRPSDPLRHHRLPRHPGPPARAPCTPPPSPCALQACSS